MPPAAPPHPEAQRWAQGSAPARQNGKTGCPCPENATPASLRGGESAMSSAVNPRETHGVPRAPMGDPSIPQRAHLALRDPAAAQGAATAHPHRVSGHLHPPAPGRCRWLGCASGRRARRSATSPPALSRSSTACKGRGRENQPRNGATAPGTPGEPLPGMGRRSSAVLGGLPGSSAARGAPQRGRGAGRPTCDAAGDACGPG